MKADEWAQIVRGLAEKRGVVYEPVGGLNPKGGPAALCPGGTNRITGQLSDEFWGASCDADEREHGGLFSKTVLPGAVLAKAHMPDLAEVVPMFNVESVEIEERVEQAVSRRKVEFESIEFNRRFLATVPSDHDPVALRELFSPGFLDWAAGIRNEVDFGITDRQLYFMWRLDQRAADEYEAALDHAGQLFVRLRAEMEEHGIHTYAAGPWHAGLEPFPVESV
ncbi:MAG: hypothetical protein K0R88_1817 [Solirubrobacterales bacterium]|jgi:hypothetical protein|nr:hypothetical protein [Solirubrobacterales bacterium]